MKKHVFQLERSVDSKLCSFHEEHHLENSCLSWKRVTNTFYIRTLEAGSDMQEQLEDTYNDVEVAPKEPSSSKHGVNMY